MLKIFSSVIAFVLTLVLLVYVFGIRTGPSVNTELVVRFAYSQEYIYELITNIAKYPERKKDLDNIEILDKNGIHIIKWRENYASGLWREYELIEVDPPYSFSYKIYDSSNNHTAEVSYFLNQTEDFTFVTLNEVGEIDNTFRRGLRFASGDASFLKREVKWLRVSILEELIDRS